MYDIYKSTIDSIIEWAEQENVYLFYQLLQLLFLSDDPSPRTKITKMA